MSHYQHIITAGDQFLQRIGNQSCTNTGIIFRGIRHASKELLSLLTLYHSLITASAHGQVHRGTSISSGCLNFLIYAHTNTQRHGEFVTHIQFLHVFQNSELVRIELLQILSREHKEETVIFQASQNAAQLRGQVTEFSKDHRLHQRSAIIIHTTDDLIIVI